MYTLTKLTHEQEVLNVVFNLSFCQVVKLLTTLFLIKCGLNVETFHNSNVNANNSKAQTVFFFHFMF